MDGSFYAQPGYGYEGALYGYPGFSGGNSVAISASNSYDLYMLQQLNASLATLAYAQNTWG